MVITQSEVSSRHTHIWAHTYTHSSGVEPDNHTWRAIIKFPGTLSGCHVELFVQLGTGLCGAGNTSGSRADPPGLQREPAPPRPPPSPTPPILLIAGLDSKVISGEGKSIEHMFGLKMSFWNMLRYFLTLDRFVCPKDLSSAIECIHITTRAGARTK